MGAVDSGNQYALARCFGIHQDVCVITTRDSIQYKYYDNHEASELKPHFPLPEMQAASMEAG